MDIADQRFLEREIRRFETLMANPGKYRVVGVGTSGGEMWVEGEYKTKGAALLVVRTKTRAAWKGAASPGEATAYYAYDDRGEYVGGDESERLRK